jgi:glycosyltransferase involved in cell wall biosynthesis
MFAASFGVRTGVDKAVASGDVARDARQWAEAEHHYRAALELDGSLAHIWVQLGHAIKEQRRLEEAELAYVRAVELDPKSSDARLQLGHCRKLLGRLAQAQADYLSALRLDGDNAHARQELLSMGWTPAATEKAAGANVVVEITDLLDHLNAKRLLTGIQRVQWELARALRNAPEQPSQLAYYDSTRDFWVEVPPADAALLFENQVAGVRLDDERRHALASAILSRIRSAPLMQFSNGAQLFNPGASWSLLNYFLSVREAKRRFGIRYLPYVHDCIPVLFPEYCTEDTVHNYWNWVLGLFQHADGICTNSRNTKADIERLAAKLGCRPVSVTAIPLNGSIDSASGESLEAEAFLARHKLAGRRYVLFVSTIEPRKNHALALSAWSELLKAREPESVPLLVCVGHKGWHSESFFETVARNPALRGHVIVLNDVPDDALGALYRHCLFTVYPSFYEGWGLPVSESLCYGKVPLVSNVASLPEAGGDVAVYFDLKSQSDFLKKLQRLIDDHPWRGELEKAIRRRSVVQPWSSIAEEILSRIRGTLEARSPAPAQLPLNLYHSFSRNTRALLRDLLPSAEPLRVGLDWWQPEEWGVWTKEHGAELEFAVVGSDEREKRDELLVYLHFAGCPNVDNEVEISAVGGRSVRAPVRRGMSNPTWAVYPVPERQARSGIRLRISPRHVDDFAVATGGIDQRRVGIGLAGIYVCRRGDLQARCDLLEAIVLGGVPGRVGQIST